MMFDKYTCDMCNVCVEDIFGKKQQLGEDARQTKLGQKKKKLGHKEPQDSEGHSETVNHVIL